MMSIDLNDYPLLSIFLVSLGLNSGISSAVEAAASLKDERQGGTRSPTCCRRR
jgi:hypothetical protein